METTPSKSPIVSIRSRSSRGTAPTPTEITADEIARLAYRFFEESGREDGHDLEHWLRAEAELKSLRSAKATARR
jgi:hypothetical protein